MRRLGISIYPEKTTQEEIFRYLEIASKNGFSRVFSCLLSVNESKKKIKQDFTKINKFAQNLGFEVIMDIAPRVFDQLGISYNDLRFFKEIHADGVRLDIGFTGLEESLMTYNEQDLKIEINMSNNVHMIDTIMDYQPNKYNLIGCHNFYPHQYSGLTEEHFFECTNRFNKYGISTAAFITSQNKNTFGPWPVTDGLPTLEIHRELPLEVQMKYYLAIDLIDDVIISNCYPTDTEVEALGELDLRYVTFNLDVLTEISDVESKILFETLHFNRGDISPNLIRSTQSRVKFKEHYFPAHNVPEDIKRGDIIIESSEYGHYAGELQVALSDMRNSGKSNVVGRIADSEIFLLDYIKPWQKFKFQKV
ncbi:DUF871 domain-containing protein [Aerococcaceae bacterium DSM 111020]|nr:DUF871 domain-containing protein [Aerococcaceae bacterium DSM 111020]